ncbi:MAG: HAD family hydrolase [Pirellulaceae bacterium]|nr:HAD family hydrolase [Pirellulaceae bacterium]
MHGIHGRLPRPVSGLLFGLEGVFCDDAVWTRWWFGLLGKLGVQADYSVFCRVWKSRYLETVHRGERSICDAFRQLMTSYGLTPAQVDELELACRARWRKQQRETRLLPGVKRTISRLAAVGMTMGVLCNSECPGTVLRERFDELGLVEVFASVISSLDLGQTKPRPLGYVRSARAMGLDPAEVAFVGHRAAELEGAVAAGMRTIAFNYESEAQADVFLGRFEQLTELFDRHDYYAAAG